MRTTRWKCMVVGATNTRQQPKRFGVWRLSLPWSNPSSFQSRRCSPSTKKPKAKRSGGPTTMYRDDELAIRILRCAHCELEREFKSYEAGEQYMVEHNRTHHPEIFARVDVRRQREIATCEGMMGAA